MRVKCLAQEHNTMTQPGLEPGPFNPESSMLTTRPPCLENEAALKFLQPFYHSSDFIKMIESFIDIICRNLSGTRLSNGIPTDAEQVTGLEKKEYDAMAAGIDVCSLLIFVIMTIKPLGHSVCNFTTSFITLASHTVVSSCIDGVHGYV